MTILAQTNLKQRVLSAGLWSLLSYAFSFAFRLGSNLFMTRQLLPEMFGLTAVAFMILTGLVLFADLGLGPSIVQNSRGDQPSFLNTVWVIQMVRGAALCLLAVATGALVFLAGKFGLVSSGSVYADPQLPYVIAALSVTTIISGCESTKLLQADRNLLLAKVTRIEVLSQVFGFFVMACWVLVNRSVWALVAGSIASACSKAFLSHVGLPGTPNRLQWDRDAAIEIARFGKWIFFSSMLFFLSSSGDRVLLGSMVDATSLGMYAIAFLIFSSFDLVLTRIIVNVSFPALSEIIRSRPATLTEAYYKFHTTIAAFTYFCAGALMISGQAVISLLYDRRYQQAGWILEILAVALLALPPRVATQSFLALGHERAYVYFNIIRSATLFACLPLGFAIWGLGGAVWTVVLSHFSSLPLIIYYAAPLGLFDWKKELRAVPALFVGMIAGGLLNTIIALIVHPG